MTDISLKLSLETGSFISGVAAARGVLNDLDRDIEKAKKDGDDARVGQLYYAKNQMMTATEGFDRDTKSLIKNPMYQQIMNKQMSKEPLTKSEEQFMARLDASTEALKKNTAAMLESREAGNAEGILKQAANLSAQAQDFHKLATGTDSKDAEQGNSVKDMVKAIGVNQIAGAFNSALSQIVNSLDRSGIINQYGSGDILGGRVAEKRRQADLLGGLAQTGLTIAGGAFGFIGSGGNPAMTMAGATGGNVAGQAINTLVHGPANKEATQAAYAGLWLNRSGQAMELAANLGNPNAVREDAYGKAAAAAVEFGYSAEEGMEAMKEAARQGLSGADAEKAARQVFEYERGTGADRGTLMGISNMSARYGAGDAMGAGWAGLQASGMKSGQYNEYLRAMQRVMEDGISKGFVRSSEQVAQNLTMLSQMTGNNPLWQGESGARRLSEISAGLEGATDLSSTSDIYAYRAAKNIAGGGSYIKAMKLLEEGNISEIFPEFMKLVSGAEGKNNYEGIVERIRQAFNLNYTNADTLYQSWASDKNISKDDIKKLIESFEKKPPDANNPDLDAAKLIAEITNIYTKSGMDHWENTINKLKDELEEAIKELDGKGGNRVDTSGMTNIEAAGAYRDEYIDAIEAGDTERANRAYLDMEEANRKALAPPLDPLEEETRALGRTSSAIKEYFSPGFAFDPFKSDKQKADRRAMNRMQDTISGAIYTGDTSQIQQAKEVLDMLGSLPQGVREKWNTENIANTLADSDGIEQLHTDLRELIGAIRENGNARVIVE